MSSYCLHHPERITLLRPVCTAVTKSIHYEYTFGPYVGLDKFALIYLKLHGRNGESACEFVGSHDNFYVVMYGLKQGALFYHVVLVYQ